MAWPGAAPERIGRLSNRTMALENTAELTVERPPYDIVAPVRHSLPLVLSSPHSGRDYPADLLATTRLDLAALRQSEDSFVDEIFSAAPDLGAPLIRANFPRVYCDPNREPFELDPAMFADRLPGHVNTTSLRVAGGLGTIPRVVSAGGEIYRDKLVFAEAERRVATLYRPYHQALAGLIEATRAGFGAALLLDCHSMPSVGGPMDRDQGTPRPDIILGDRYGTSCDPALSADIEEIVRDLGYRVCRNAPYAGGYTTVHYGRPEMAVHGLQIEINRALYMNERTIERLPALRVLAADMARLIRRVGEVVVDRLPLTG